MIAHSSLWATPQPFWGRFAPENGPASFGSVDQGRPAILRFKSDEFMDQVLAILAADPKRLADAIARPETWRNPGGEPEDVTEPTPVPRLARVFKRMRRGAATRDDITATTDVAGVDVNGVRRHLPLKLYHPAHQRHYLVAAHLVCGIPGFPEKGIATGGREQIGFVLRRLVKESDAAGAPEREYAFVKEGRGARWQLIPTDESAPDQYARAVAGEEMLPLFPLNFHDDVGHPRRLLAGTIPVGRREEYLGTRFETDASLALSGTSPQARAASDGQTRKSARKEQFKMDVSEPWKALIRGMYKVADRIQSGTKPDGMSDAAFAAKKVDSALHANEGAQMQAWLILLDFADFLAHHVKPVWEAVKSDAAPALTDIAHIRLFNWLNQNTAVLNTTGLSRLTGATFVSSIRAALKTFKDKPVRDALEAAENTFVVSGIGNGSWPGFYYLLAGVKGTDFSFAGVQDSLSPTQTPATDPLDLDANPAEPTPATSAKVVEETAAKVDKLVQLVMAAVDVEPTGEAPPVPFAVQVRDAMRSVPDWDEKWFVLRCVYVRCDCGPLQPTVFSAPSQRFQLASFFDSDAPARPIRIALPIDTTAAGMRKHQKNTAFVISDALCGQFNRMKGLGFIDLVLHVLPWPFHKDLDIGNEGIGPCKKDGLNLGMICSLSIPIITICALILLLMIVLVLDFVFKWIPWFIVCFPLPKFKAKNA